MENEFKLLHTYPNRQPSKYTYVAYNKFYDSTTCFVSSSILLQGDKLKFYDADYMYVYMKSFLKNFIIVYFTKLRPV